MTHCRYPRHEGIAHPGLALDPGTLEHFDAGTLEVVLGLLVVGAHQSDGIQVVGRVLIPHHDQDPATLLGLLLEDLAQRLPLVLGVVLSDQLQLRPYRPPPNVDELLGILDGLVDVHPQLGWVVRLAVSADDVGDGTDLGVWAS